jgi:hypothetical protein
MSFLNYLLVFGMVAVIIGITVGVAGTIIYLRRITYPWVAITVGIVLFIGSMVGVMEFMIRVVK